MSYIIQSQQSSHYCLGVLQATVGQPLVLTLQSGAQAGLTRWQMNSNGTIALAANPSLVLDYAANPVGPGYYLVFLNQLATPIPSNQTWRWSSSSPYIANGQVPSSVIDNSQMTVQVNNAIILYPNKNDTSTNQKWTLVAQ